MRHTEQEIAGSEWAAEWDHMASGGRRVWSPIVALRALCRTAQKSMPATSNHVNHLLVESVGCVGARRSSKSACCILQNY